MFDFFQMHGTLPPPCSKHFVQSVLPVTPASIQKKASAVLKMARDGAHLSMDEFDRAMYVLDSDYIAGDGIDGDDTYSDGDDGGEYVDEGITPGDLLGKVLALVKQVRLPT
jgi:hypothetical protein